MSLAKSLTEEQIATIQSWADAGDGLSEIQSRLGSEMDAKLTYLETRFLLDDIGVELKKEPEPEKEEKVEALPAESPAPNVEKEEPEELSGDDVALTIDKLQRPGALMSGTVTFAGNQGAAWWIDQTGQLGLDPGEEGFNPSPEQMMKFQSELQAAIQKSGM